MIFKDNKTLLGGARQIFGHNGIYIHIGVVMLQRLLSVVIAAGAISRSMDAFCFQRVMHEGNKHRSKNGANMRAIRASRKQKTQKRTKR